MTTIKSLEDLKKIREEALEKRKVKASEGKAQVSVAMGTCGIAAGARETMKAILDVIEKDNISGIIVTQTGCIGLCEKEPIVQVTVGTEPKVVYGKVTPELARRIMKEHIGKGNIIKENVIQA
ncbi:NADH dehydrogenase [Leptolinea tardivitalis]|uniref:NADH dehydrogenase n=2 Tax=Leptolinea tardivitalis TaxID=229920 RepID=A0A0P6X1C8_9CHLR|nr:NADH dehydrogenase [Leptolinea tardivitalis]GAP22926.1 NAD(P)-dependent iron-only hydrogenase iron-sulfur protein [Leptolinea tardivitalis]